jgi:hypothetical protein
MIEMFKMIFSTEIETINLYDLHIKESCMGCINCGYDNKCVYEGVVSIKITCIQERS